MTGFRKDTAQKRADRIEAFTAELETLLDEQVLSLTPENRARIDARVE